MKMTSPDTVDSHTTRMLLDHLSEHGYEGEAQETADRLTIAVIRNALDDAQLKSQLTENRSSNGPFSQIVWALR